jgi:hypothetical protein
MVLIINLRIVGHIRTTRKGVPISSYREIIPAFVGRGTPGSLPMIVIHGLLSRPITGCRMYYCRFVYFKDYPIGGKVKLVTANIN